jgi:thioredoxin reductase (NADPH)
VRAGRAAVARKPYPRQRAPVRRARARTYDAIIIGGGPAGLSAAIYLARFNRRVIVIDAGEGRSTTHETNENYLGFPRGVRSRALRERGCRQATRFGADVLEARATSARRNADGFVVRAGRRAFHGDAIILATGVKDRFPDISEIERYVGVSVFWCITCDGWKARDKRVLVVGNDDEAATTALQFLNFTNSVTLLTNAPHCKIATGKQRALSRAGVPVIAGIIAAVRGRGGRLRDVRTSDDVSIPLDMMFSMQGCDPNVGLARSLGVRLDGRFIKTDLEQRTNVKRVYAAGDVTKAFAHQVVTAAHEGATAAQSANYDLYRPWQRDS